MAKGHPKLHSKPTKAHPGFKAEEKKLVSKGMPKKEADAILGKNYYRQLAKRGK